MRFDQGFFLLMPIWTAAQVFKASRALRSGEPYQFKWWDGGMILAGKYLRRTATQIRLASMVLLCGYSAALLAGHLPFHQGQIICLVLIGVVLVVDFSSAKSEREKVIPQAKVE